MKKRQRDRIGTLLNIVPDSIQQKNPSGLFLVWFWNEISYHVYIPIVLLRASTYKVELVP
jgi:hypothetical protein